MKQFQIIYKKNKGFFVWLNQIRQYLEEHSIKESSAVFRIFTDSIRKERITPVLSALHETFPDAPYAGISTLGNVIHGSLSDTGISLVCSVFEDPDTQVRILQLPMTYESQAETADKLLEAVKHCPWVSAVEMLTTLSEVDMPAFCSRMSALPPKIQVYGGGALGMDVPNGDFTKTFVFSSEGEASILSAVFILMGGPGLKVSTGFLTGWRRLGSTLTVTSAEKNFLLQLNGQPAAKVYQHYLNIPENEDFYPIANEFPLLFEEKGIPFLRDVIMAQPDGSLRMGANIEGAKECSIAFGDPVHIMETIREELKKVHAFAPQSIQLFSCAARKYFWGDRQVSREMLPFETVAPSSGFFSSGEFLRTEGKIIMHNLSLVIVAMREGEPEGPPEELTVYEKDEFSRQLLVTNCLVSFIQAQREEIEELKQKQ